MGFHLQNKAWGEKGISKLCIQAELIFLPITTWLWEAFRESASHEYLSVKSIACDKGYIECEDAQHASCPPDVYRLGVGVKQAAYK